MNKRILIAVVVLAVAIVAAVAVYLVTRNRGTEPASTSTPNTTQSNQLPTGESPSVTNQTPQDGGSETPSSAQAVTPVLSKIVNNKVVAPQLTSDGKGVIFFNEATGQIFVANFDGSNQRAIADSTFKNVVDVAFSPTGRSAILSFKSPTDNPIKYYFDIPSNSTNRLSDHIESFAYSPDGNKIFYRYADTANSLETLNVANANGTDFQKIKDFPISNVELVWVPGKDKLSFWLAPFALRRSALYKMDQDGTNVIALFNKGYGVDGLWSGDGSRVIATFAAENTVSLHIEAANFDGSEKVILPSSKTVIEKCTWANDNINVFCAIPKQVAPSAVLPDDYTTGKISTDDDIYKINTKTGERLLVRLAEIVTDDQGNQKQADLPQIDAARLFLSPDNKQLFFINKADGSALYAVDLNKAGI